MVLCRICAFVADMPRDVEKIESLNRDERRCDNKAQSFSGAVED